MGKYKQYICGKLSTVEINKDKNLLILKYCEELKIDFTKNYIKIEFDKSSNKFSKIYINTYKFGILDIKDGLIKISRWETEDETQSHFGRRGSRLSNKTIEDPEIKSKIVDEIIQSIKGKNIRKSELKLINMALEINVSK
jgi:hypothetical protein